MLQPRSQSRSLKVDDVALNQEEIQALRNAGLIDLFEEHLALWKEQAKDAYAYAHKYISGEVRVDDVIQVLVPALAINNTLHDYLSEKKLKQKYWDRYFGDYILDQLWQDLTSEGEGDDD